MQVRGSQEDRQAPLQGGQMGVRAPAHPGLTKHRPDTRREFPANPSNPASFGGRSNKREPRSPAGVLGHGARKAGTRAVGGAARTAGRYRPARDESLGVAQRPWESTARGPGGPHAGPAQGRGRLRAPEDTPQDSCGCPETGHQSREAVAGERGRAEALAQAPTAELGPTVGERGAGCGSPGQGPSGDGPRRMSL